MESYNLPKIFIISDKIKGELFTHLSAHSPINNVSGKLEKRALSGGIVRFWTSIISRAEQPLVFIVAQLHTVQAVAQGRLSDTQDFGHRLDISGVQLIQ